MSVTCERSVVSPISSTNKTDCHDRTEILLKVALNTIKQTRGSPEHVPGYSCHVLVQTGLQIWEKKLYVHIPIRSYVKSRSSFSNGIGIKKTIIWSTKTAIRFNEVFVFIFILVLHMTVSMKCFIMGKEKFKTKTLLLIKTMNKEYWNLYNFFYSSMWQSVTIIEL